MTKLDMVRFGITIGCFWSLCVFSLGFISRTSQKAEEFVQLFSKVYRGFGGNLSGSLTGALWGFLDGTISGLLIAWIYNAVVS